MANIYSALYQDSDYWDGTTSWGGYVSEVARDAHFTGGGFTSISAWVNDRDGKSSGGNVEILEIIGPWSSALVEAHFDIDSFSSDSVEIYAIGDALNNGIIDGSGCVVDFQAENGIDLEEPVTLRGFQITTTGTFCIQRSDPGDNCVLDSMILKFGGSYRACDDYVGSGSLDIINSVVFSANLGNGDGIYGDDLGATVNVYNSLVYGFNVGIYEKDAVVNSYNTVSCNNAAAGDDFQGGTVISNCASDDGDGTNPQTLDNTNDYEDEFVDAPNGNFTLVAGSVCIENGVDDPGSGLYSDDILGVSRTSTWDIGPFEYVPLIPGLRVRRGLLLGVY